MWQFVRECFQVAETKIVSRVSNCFELENRNDNVFRYGSDQHLLLVLPQAFFAKHNLSFGIEGGNGCLTAVGPVPGLSSVTNYYWHGGASLGTWNRIIGGMAHSLHSLCVCVCVCVCVCGVCVVFAYMQAHMISCLVFATPLTHPFLPGCVVVDGTHVTITFMSRCDRFRFHTRPRSRHLCWT